ncbi:MAG: sterol desaturase family protein [Sphingomonas sp.]|uniref:sterol desaturase family protein n=1 Tax=Sphingomonas sp. TaxID=28214 RepID=UPI001AC8383B|nr:sterol desaturase family protein [Sphingomonas sp.]MBN8808642.1 sterol desaturase family protein [Sphingomonas sp.]
MNGIVIDVIRLSLWLALLATLFTPLEWLFSLHDRRSAAGRRRGWLADLGYYYLNGLLPGLLLAPPLAVVALAVHAVTPDAYAAWIAALPFGVKLGAGLLVSEIGAYWGHRWCHTVPFLWRFHAIHHSVERLDWLANTRAHPLDIVFVRLCGLVPLYALGLASPRATGAAAMIPVYIALAGTVWSFLVHANVRWRFGFLEQLAATPAFHHWHHTNGAEGRDRNYAAMFPWVDRLFGTLHLPRDAWPPVYGIDAPIEGGMAAELIHPFQPPRRAPSASGQPSAPPQTGPAVSHAD